MFKGQHEFKEAVIPESTYECMEFQSYQGRGYEFSAVDLRTTKPPTTVDTSRGNIKYYTNKKDADSMGHEHSNDLYFVDVASGAQVENPSQNANYTAFNYESDKYDINQASHNHCTSYQKIDPQKKYTLKRISSSNPIDLNAENGADFVLLVDQETQTQTKESTEASVQTDKDASKCTNSLLKRRGLSSLNYCCLVCQRFYTSKSSYDRHARTHVVNGNVITNLHITKKANLMILGENICKSQTHIDLPMALQEPKLTKFQCDICCKSFSSQDARDFHMDNFFLQNFPMIKCKECHVKFFTLGALHEHVNVVHEISSKKCNTYCCIFCNESFESSFNFQLHLDEHLSTQVNI